MKLQPLPARGHNCRTTGLTAYEVTVVLVIAGILVAVGSYPWRIMIESDGQQRREAICAMKAIADISTIDSTLDTYKLDTGHYPSQAQGLRALVTNVAIDPK